MAFESDDVRRVDIGDGIHVHVASHRDPVRAGPAATAPRHEVDHADATRAATPAWNVQPFALGLGAGVGLLALLRLGVTPHGVLAAGVLAVLAVLSAVDIRWRILPNRIVLPATAAVLVWQVAFFP